MKISESSSKTVILNLVSTFFIQGISFLTIPIFTRLLGTNQYGLYSIFVSWASILASIYGFGVTSTIAVGIYRFKEEYYKYRSSILLLASIINTFIIIICLVARKEIYQNLNFDKAKLILLIGVALGQFWISFIQTAFIYEKKPVENFIISIILAISGVILSFVLVIKFQSEVKYYGKIIGTGLPQFLIGGIICLLFFFKQPTGISFKYARFSLRMGLPIVLHNLANNILSQSDRVMMEQQGISNSDIGVYSFYYTLSSILLVILNALNTSWCPFYYDDLNNNDFCSIKKKSRNYLELFSIFVLGFLLISKEISHIVAPSDYWKGENIIPYLALTVFFTLLYQFPVNYEFYHKKTKMVAVGTIMAAFLNIVLNTFFIPLMGIRGAAIATCLSYFALFAFHLFIAGTIKEPYHMKLIEFIPWIMIIIIGILFFKFASKLYMIRWCLAFIISIFELFRIYKRRSVF